MNDVFDDELMKELGLEIEEEKPAAPPKPEAKTAPKPAGAPAKPAAPQRPAPPARPQQPAAAQKPPQPQPQPRPKQPASPPPKPAQPPQTEKKSVPPKPAPPVSAESQANKISHEIPIQLAAVVAKKTLRLSDILAMNVGEILEFKKTHNEPIDLVANGKLIAKAELVMVEGKLGARIIKLVR